MAAIEDPAPAAAADAWQPKFLCHSFKSPIVLSDGVVTSCTLDHRGRNRVGSIFEDDFDALIDRYGGARLQAMQEPLSKPLCHACYTRLPRWREQQVPRSGWFNESIGEASKQAYRGLYNDARLSFNIELSSACNLRCTGCSLADPAFRSSRAAPNIDLDRLMAWLDGHVHRIAHVRLYHMGETWLHPRWFEFCRFLKDRNPAITLFTSTNGVPLDSEAKLAQVIASGIDHVMFSIHGTTQASTEAYMGKAFRIDAALAAARRLVALRRGRQPALYLSWKYLLFEWNDSDEEIETAKTLCDEIGFDELHFSITSQPAPSKRFSAGSAAWAAVRQACAAASPRAADFQVSTPMTAIYPGRLRRRQAVAWPLPPGDEAAISVASPPGPVQVVLLPTPAGELARRAREALAQGRVLAAVRLLEDGLPGVVRPSAGLHRAHGDALLAAGRPALAVGAFEAALRLEPAPRSEHVHLGLARSLRAVGRAGEAEAAYELALRLRETGTAGLYGEDLYLELRDTSLGLGRTAAAATAARMWTESAWLADTRSRVVYCPIAKNACTFMKAALVLNSERAEAFRASGMDAHVFTRTRANGLRLGDVRYLADPRYFSLVLLRDPFDRLASAYGYNFVRPLQWRKVPDAPGRAIVSTVHLAEGREPDWEASVSFEQFVRHIITCPDAALDHHWRPQRAFFDDIASFSHVGCVERLDDTLAVLSARRRWRFDFATDALRNALPRAELPAAPYHRWSPRALSALPGFPTGATLQRRAARTGRAALCRRRAPARPGAGRCGAGVPDRWCAGLPPPGGGARSGATTARFGNGLTACRGAGRPSLRAAAAARATVGRAAGAAAGGARCRRLAHLGRRP